MFSYLIPVFCFLLAVDSIIIRKRDDCDEAVDCTQYLDAFFNNLPAYLPDFANTGDLADYCALPIDQCIEENKAGCDHVNTGSERLSNAYDYVCSDSGKEVILAFAHSDCWQGGDEVFAFLQGIVDCASDFEDDFQPLVENALDSGEDLNEGDVCSLKTRLQTCLQSGIVSTCGEKLKVTLDVTGVAADYAIC